MTQEHCFPQLVQLMDEINKANSSDETASDVGSDEQEDEDDTDRLLGLPGISGEAKLTMLTDDLLQKVEENRSFEPEVKKTFDDDFSDEKGKATVKRDGKDG